MKEALSYLKQSLEDRILTKSEKKALKAVIGEKGFNKHELNRLRSEIFTEARKHYNEFKHLQVIDWLEEANKLILPQATRSFYCHSYFSPGQECLNCILTQISYAVNKIDICVFTISDNDIRDKLEYALNKGVRVRIITDDEKTNDLGSDIEYLQRKGADVKIDNSSHHMHHKFAIFDNETLLTGSYNWTRSAAQYNQENILETNDPKAIISYQKEFDKLWKTMSTY
ncbi:MAG: phospholipase D-like domain-containing protein [Carboxylicivirga sp.]|jgi:phosphatidylserine/phosphatidylglycerophosphate/cardiolipin synthase-like enzyme|nr:phospholipase D-like domain-containing protein [Carboxylicivirga sp.]